MEERPFLDETAEPTEQMLKKSLKDSYVYYKALIKTSDSFLKNWNFSKSSGWMLKVHQKKKALFYIIPLEKKFKISMAIRENERKLFLEDNDLKIVHNEIKSSKKYREGYALRFDIENADDLELINLFIMKLMVLRS